MVGYVDDIKKEPLTGTSSLGDDGLSSIAVNKDGRSLDVVQFLAGEWVSAI